MSEHHNSQESILSGSKLLITIAAMLASLMAVLDISIVNVAINDIRASFGVQLDQIAWISTGYMMANVIVIPLTGWFQKRYGLRNYFIFSIFLFTVASLFCGLSWNLFSLTFFRILQGMGGGAIIPTASTILMSRYPREQQGMAQAFIGLGAMTGPLLGPTIGGYLIEVSSWHMIFLINIPFGILAIAIAYLNIKETNFVPHAPKFDFKGLVLIAIGLGSLQFVLEEGNHYDWFHSNMIVFFAIVSAICLITLVVQQLEEKHPMIDFKVFKNRNYFLCSTINFFLGTTLFGASFLFSLFCGSVLNYSPLDIGMLFLKGSCVQLIMMPLVGQILPKVDGRYLIVVGIILVATSIFYNSQLTHMTTNYDLIEVLFIRSLGLACVFIPLSVIAVQSFKNSEIGNAVGLFNLTRELGGSIGLAVMASELVNHIQIFNSYLKDYLTTGNSILMNQMQQMKGAFYGKVPDVNAAVNLQIHNKVTLQATVQSFGLSFFYLSLIFFGTLIIILFLKNANTKNSKVKMDGFH